MSNEEKKDTFLKKAHDNKENFELHKRLIDESIKPLQAHLGKDSVKYFYDTGSVSGGFLLALMDYAEKYADTKVKNFSSNTMLCDSLPADLVREIEIHIETTKECIENFGIPNYVKELLEQDIKMYEKILARCKAGYVA